MLVMGVLAGTAFQVSARETALTIYTADCAVVRLIDEMSFEKGLKTLSFTGISKSIDPTSVRFSTVKSGIHIVEQNFRYDLAGSHRVLERYIDRDITLITGDGVVIEGTLMSITEDIVVQQKEGGLTVVRADAVKQYSLPELPEGLISHPTLFWLVYSDMTRTTDTEISYITYGLGWQADYTAVVNDDETGMELSSWVTIINNSGVSYENAALKLVAGDLNIVRPEPRLKRDLMFAAQVADEEYGKGFEERGLLEYHLYELQGKTTVGDSETRQIALFPPSEVRVEKRLLFDQRKNNGKVAVAIEFVNSEAEGLGMPLPAGKVRVYKRDTDRAIEFVGEDMLDHTPKNERRRLTIGSSFDVVAERTILDTRHISQTVREETVSIQFRNRKEEAVQVTAIEHLYGDWDIIEQSDRFEKKDAFTAECTVAVPADAEKTVTFTVRYR